jgi:DNA-binding transcriptional ArsR family regulator
MSRGTALWLGRPVLRQIKLAVDEGAALVRDISRKHADLTFGDLSRRSGVLPSNPTRALALLEKAGLVDDEHRIRRSKRLDCVLAHQVAQGVCVPMAAAEHRLLAPRPRIPRGFGPHPAGLASLGTEQPIEEGGGRGGDAGMRKQGSEVSFDLTQLRTPEVEHLLYGHTHHGGLLGQIRR